MESQINKWGNSAAIRIPSTFMSDLGLSINSAINIELSEGRIVIEPKRKGKNLRLPFTEESLLEGLDSYSAHADELASPMSSELGE